MTGVLAYYRARLATLGRTEWRDPDPATMPKPRMNALFHLTPGIARGLTNNQDSLTSEVETVVRLPFMPSRKPTNIADDAISFAQTVINDLLDANNRLTASGIKNVYFDTMALEPIDESNDNGVIIVMGFRALVIVSTR